MKYFTGIDIGSSTIKIAILNSNKELVTSYICPTGSTFRKNTENAFEKTLHLHDLSSKDVTSIITTGYGRKLYPDAKENISEISANALGVNYFSNGIHSIRTIINVGGQDSKIIHINEEGLVRNFVMNDKCAAGTGRFLEIVARILELDVDEMGDLHFAGKDNYPVINSTCAVFAESEIISLLATGHSKAQIAAGVHYSIAKRIIRLSSKIRIEHPVLFDGGAALNKGLHAALEDELMKEVMILKDPQITTAVGAAVKAFDGCKFMEK